MQPPPANAMGNVMKKLQDRCGPIPPADAKTIMKAKKITGTRLYLRKPKWQLPENVRLEDMTPRFFMDRNGAPGSLKQRRYVWKIWLEYTQFCGVIGRKCEPITGTVLSEFACWWFKKGTVMSKSLNTYLSCLNHELHNQGKGLDRERDAVNCAHVLGGIRWVCHEMLGVEEGKQQRALTNEFCDEFVRQAETKNDAHIILVC